MVAVVEVVAVVVVLVPLKAQQRWWHRLLRRLLLALRWVTREMLHVPPKIRPGWLLRPRKCGLCLPLPGAGSPPPCQRVQIRRLVWHVLMRCDGSAPRLFPSPGLACGH
jgi:hypothetical protein